MLIRQLEQKTFMSSIGPWCDLTYSSQNSEKNIKLFIVILTLGNVQFWLQSLNWLIFITKWQIADVVKKG